MSITPITAPITAYSTPPTTSDPTNFDARADVLFGTELPRGVSELNVFVTAINVMIGETNTAVSDVTTKQGIASTAAANAAISEANALADRLLAQTAANTAVNAPGSAGTSTTSTALTVGLKSLVTQTGKNWQVGQTANLARTSAPTTSKAVTTIAAYNSVTGAIDLNIAAASDITGSGTFTDWTISLGGATGPAGAAGAAGSVAMGRKTITGTDTIVAADLSKVIRCTGTTDYTVTMGSAASCGVNYFVSVFNRGSGTVTIAAASIDGYTYRLLFPGDGMLIQGDGTDFRTERLDGDISLGALGAAVVAQSNSVGVNVSVCRLSDTLAIALYLGASSYPRAVAMSISGSAVTCGTPLNLENFNAAGAQLWIRPISASTALAVWYVSSASEVRGCILSVSGTTVTNASGGSYPLVSSAIDGLCLAVASPTLAFLTYNASSQMRTMPLTISGASVSAGTQQSVSAGNGSYPQICAVSATKVVLLYRNPTAFMEMIVATWGGSSFSFGAAVLLTSEANATNVGIVLASTNKVVAYLRRGGTNGNSVGEAYTVDVSGTPTPSPPAILGAYGGEWGLTNMCRVSDNMVVMVGRSNNNKAYSVLPLSVRGNLVQAGGGRGIQPISSWPSDARMAVDKLNASQLILFYGDTANGEYPTARVVDLGSCN